MATLLSSLRNRHKDLVFEEAKTFYWSPKQQIIFYSPLALDSPEGAWSLLHELSHALLEHQDFNSDFELLQIEVAAWQKAQELAKEYNIDIDADHIEDCLDTYRDWLYQRSSCPSCTSCSLQVDKHTYSCLNCGTRWQVSQSRLCRPYRRKQKAK